MKKYIQYFILSLQLFMIGGITNAQNWVNLGSSTPKEIKATVTESNHQSIRVLFDTKGFNSESINEGNAVYQRLSIPGAGRSQTVGIPELPSFRQMVAIPECSNVSLSFQVLQEQVLNNYNVYPAPDYQVVTNPDSTCYVEEVFSKNVLCYVDNLISPSNNAELTETGYFRSQKYVEIQVSPIRYNPSTQKLYVATEIEVTLTLTNATGATSANLGIFNNVATHTMLNYESTGMTAEENDMRSGLGKVKYFTITNPNQVDTIVADYLMICASHLFGVNGVPCDPLLELAHHRASYNGYDVAILNVDNILEQNFNYQNDNINKVEKKLRTCISRIYRNGTANHTYDGHLGFVLFVGKAPVYDMNSPIESCQGFVPSAYSHGIAPHFSGEPSIPYPSDYWFSCISNNAGMSSYDSTGDLFIGRICVDNSENAVSQLQNIVSKTIKRERRFNPRVKNIVDAATGAGLAYSNSFPTIFYGPLQTIIGGQRILSKVDFYEVPANSYSDSVKIMLERGAPLFIIINHGGVGEWSNIHNAEGFDNSGTMNQFCFSHSCLTGRFDTIYNCLGQKITSGYADKGFVGFIGSGRVVSQTSSMDLDLPKAIYNHLSHIAGECLLESNLAMNISENRFKYNLIGDPALNIMSKGFEVTDVITLSDSTDITTSITIKDEGIVKVPINAKIRIHDNAGFIISPTGRIHFLGNATLRSVNGNNSFVKVNGGTITYNNSNPGTTIFKNLKINFNNPQYLPNFGYQFNNHRYHGCNISAVGVSLAYSYCQFYEGCSLYASHSDLDVDHSEFDHSGIVVSRNSVIGIPVGGSVPSTSATITNSTFNNCTSVEYQHYGVNDRSISNAAIRLERVPNYGISGNTIMGCLQGIYLTNSGTGNLYSIMGNTIQNNRQDGIIVYNSYANLTLNTIQGNGSNLAGNGNEFEGNGISIYNNSLTQVGDITEPSNNYQLIGWNCNHQIYASNNAFPQLFRYNKVLGDKNGTTNPWIYYDVEGSLLSESRLIDVEHNNWDGNTNFNASVVFNVPYLFDWDPFWNMAKGGEESSDAEILYEQARKDFEDSLYAKARTEFMQLISEYSEEPLAVSALKEMFRLERFLNNDYSWLKTYYLTNESIIANSTLQKVGEFLSARCDVQMNNYFNALDWYAEQLSNDSLPYQDSVFCIIDVGDICLMMAEDSVNRRVLPKWFEKHSEILPKSSYEHQKNTEYLLSTLPLIKSFSSVEEILNSHNIYNGISSISPNPASDEISIVFQLERRFGSVEIRIVDLNGKVVAVKKADNIEIGTNILYMNNLMLPQGIYVCALIVDGILFDQEKIILINK